MGTDVHRTNFIPRVRKGAMFMLAPFGKLSAALWMAVLGLSLAQAGYVTARNGQLDERNRLVLLGLLVETLGEQTDPALIDKGIDPPELAEHVTRSHSELCALLARHLHDLPNTIRPSTEATRSLLLRMAQDLSVADVHGKDASKFVREEGAKLQTCLNQLGKGNRQPPWASIMPTLGPLPHVDQQALVTARESLAQARTALRTQVSARTDKMATVAAIWHACQSGRYGMELHLAVQPYGQDEVGRNELRQFKQDIDDALQLTRQAQDWIGHDALAVRCVLHYLRNMELRSSVLAAILNEDWCKVEQLLVARCREYEQNPIQV